MFGRAFAISLFLLLATCSGGTPAFADFETTSVHKRVRGAVDFCVRQAADCAPVRDAIVTLNFDLLMLLDTVTKEINGAIAPVTDMEQFGLDEVWTYPVTGKGDCEDYALEKRRRLMEVGLPAGALKIVIAEIRPTGQLHAMLSVSTDMGPLILDNRYDEVAGPRQLPEYRFVLIQDLAQFTMFRVIDGATL